MSSGAFRDASAAIERAAMLEEENETLRTELAEIAKLRIEVEELAKLREEVAELRALARSENESGYVKRLGEERDELATEVKTLRERLAVQQGELAKANLAARMRTNPSGVVEPVLESLLGLLKRK